MGVEVSVVNAFELEEHDRTLLVEACGTVDPSYTTRPSLVV